MSSVDIVIARILVQRGLVPPDVVEETLRAIHRDRAAGTESRGGLLKRLVAQGRIDADTAKRIRAEAKHATTKRRETAERKRAESKRSETKAVPAGVQPAPSDASSFDGMASSSQLPDAYLVGADEFGTAFAEPNAADAKVSDTAASQTSRTPTPHIARHAEAPPHSHGPDDDPFVGRVIGGCRLLERVGEGGMGTIYRALHIGLDKVVAFKILPPIHRSNPRRVERFKREARSAALIEHPNIVQILNVGEDGETPYIIMQFIHGEDLRQRLERLKTIAADDALQIAIGVAKGLAVAHEKGIVHRDIKPDNIMFGEMDRVKITDFGLAKGVQTDIEVSNPGKAVGTPYYMSPEQCAGRDLDGRSDIYSLGATLYHILTGTRPFKGETPVQTALMHLRTPLTPPRHLNPDIPPALDAVICKMMAKRPQDRYQSAEDLLAVLLELEQSLGVGASPLAQVASYLRETNGVALEPATDADAPVDAEAVSEDTTEPRGLSRRLTTIGIALLSLLLLGLAWLLLTLDRDPSGNTANNGDTPAQPNAPGDNGTRPHDQSLNSEATEMTPEEEQLLVDLTDVVSTLRGWGDYPEALSAIAPALSGRPSPPLRQALEALEQTVRDEAQQAALTALSDVSRTVESALEDDNFGEAWSSVAGMEVDRAEFLPTASQQELQALKRRVLDATATHLRGVQQEVAFELQQSPPLVFAVRERLAQVVALALPPDMPDPVATLSMDLDEQWQSVNDDIADADRAYRAALNQRALDEADAAQGLLTDTFPRWHRLLATEANLARVIAEAEGLRDSVPPILSPVLADVLSDLRQAEAFWQLVWEVLASRQGRSPRPYLFLAEPGVQSLGILSAVPGQPVIATTGTSQGQKRFGLEELDPATLQTFLEEPAAARMPGDAAANLAFALCALGHSLSDAQREALPASLAWRFGEQGGFFAPYRAIMPLIGLHQSDPPETPRAARAMEVRAHQLMSAYPTRGLSALVLDEINLRVGRPEEVLLADLPAGVPLSVRNPFRGVEAESARTERERLLERVDVPEACRGVPVYRLVLARTLQSAPDEYRQGVFARAVRSMMIDLADRPVFRDPGTHRLRQDLDPATRREYAQTRLFLGQARRLLGEGEPLQRTEFEAALRADPYFEEAYQALRGE